MSEPLRRCVMCKQEKPVTEFNRHRKRRDGLQPHCRDCNRKRGRRYYAENREKHRGVVAQRNRRFRAENARRMLGYLSEHPCVDCGETDVVVLEFDHLRDKRANVSRLLHSMSKWDVVMVEIAKCDVVCANCHRRRTYKRQDSYRLRST